MSFSHPRGETNRNKILGAILELGGDSIAPSRIKGYLDMRAHNIVDLMMQHTSLSRREKISRIKELTMSETAMFSGLKKLTEQGKLVKNNRSYSISERMKSDIRFLPKEFGDIALGYVMGGHYPTIHTLEDNLDELIKIFGAYLVYCFIEAARPVFQNNEGGKPISNLDKDKLSSKWIQKVFSPLDMYQHFLFAIKNQPDDNTVEQTLKNNFKEIEKGKFVYVDDSGDDSKGPPSTRDFVYKHLLPLTSGFNYKGSKPLYEVDRETVKKLTFVFKTLHPLIYGRLLEARVGFLGKPKEQWLPEKKKNRFTYFDYNKDEE